MIPAPAGRPSGTPSLDEFLRGRREEIVRRWTERVRRELGEKLPEPELVDSLPALLERMEAAVQFAPSAGPVDAAARLVASPAAVHGAQRAALGVDIDDLVWEYGTLRDVILDLVEEHGLLPTLDEIRALTGIVATIVAEAVNAYTAERGRRFRETTGRLHGIADHAPSIICVRDAGGRFAFVNAAFAELAGRRREELVGRTYEEVSPDLHAWLSRSDARVERGETVELDETFPSPEGERAFHVLKFPLPSEPGAVGVIGFDVTERKKAERQLEQAHEVEQQLIGIVSHDLRTPLNTIVLGAGALLAREDLRDAHRSGVARILASAEQASRMIADLLDVSRARTGGIPIKPRTVDLGTAVSRAVEEYRRAYPDRGIRLSSEGGAVGRWDADRLVQALGNLVNNAVKYGAPGSEIEVRLEADRDSARLSVHNAGDPIPPSVLPTLFQPGARHAADPSDHGLGLGLYIVERIAAAHGGVAAVSSTKESGTTFTILLPRESAS